MQFTVLTLFPEQIEQNIRCSITGRALEKGLFALNCLNIRDFADNPYGKIDDTIFGGGKGMLMQCEPIYRAWLEAKNLAPMLNPRTIYLSPKGKKLDQALVQELAKEEQLIFLCGHYEGVDARVLDAMGAEEISIGDYVLTGGELAAAVLIDATARLIPGVLPAEEVHEQESHSDGTLECRHFTKPASWQGMNVPETLSSGHHARIEAWRKNDGLAETLHKAPHMFDRLSLAAGEHADLIEFLKHEYKAEVYEKSEN